MKKYTKPTVQVVNLKSSNDIAAATSFEYLKKQMVKEYLLGEATKEYAVSIYSNYNSAALEVSEG